MKREILKCIFDDLTNSCAVFVTFPSETFMNGLIKLHQTGVDASTINSVNIGSLDKDSIFKQVEAFIDGQHDQV